VKEPDHPVRPSAWLQVLGLAWALLAPGVMLTFWQGPYLFTLASAFRAHLVVGLLLFGLPLVAFHPSRQRWLFLALPLAVGITFASYLVPRDLPGPADGEAPRSAPLGVAVVNLWSGNRDLGRLAQWLDTETPDLVALLEVTEAHRAQLESLPYEVKFLHPRNSNFGLALLCRAAPEQLVVLDEESPFPSLLASWSDYRLLVTHPMPPISATARQAGDDQLERLYAGLREGPPLIVVGDLNATGWDLRTRPLREAGMVEARRGHGMLPTWPVRQGWLGIPIDHIYLPAGWQSLECRRGPDIGSDHFPLFCRAARPLPEVAPVP
jgi:endonuclease/exonuclease/phosphatase (EEP) superfamily protein YafD